MSAKVEVEKKNISVAVLQVLVMFFLLWTNQQCQHNNTLTTGTVFICCFVGRGTTIYSTQHRGKEAHYVCLGLFKAVYVAYRG